MQPVHQDARDAGCDVAGRDAQRLQRANPAGQSGSGRVGYQAALRQRFGRQLFLAEYAYPSGQMNPPYPWNNSQPGYPQTPDGQFRYLRDLTAMAVQAGTIAGIRPWAPDYCLTSGGWQPMSLFTTSGTAAPALTGIQAGIQPSTRQLH